MLKKFQFFIIILAGVFCLAGTAFAITATERAELIQQIASQLAVLRQQMALLQASGSSNLSSNLDCHIFNINLSYGNYSTEVSALQSVLIKGKFLDLSAPTGYYGTKTFYAVAAFQYKYASEILTPYGLSKPTGKVGPATRGKLNSLYGCDDGEAETNDTSGVADIPDYTENVDVVEEEFVYEETIEEPVTEDGLIVEEESVVEEEFIEEDEPIEEPVVEEEAVEEVSEEEITVCIPNWQAGTWLACVNSRQTRPVADLNNCGVTTNKPATTQTCTTTITCVPNWACVWGSCVNGYKWQNTVDLNNCGQLPGQYDMCSSALVACATTSTQNQPTVTVVSPNGGESWKIGETHNITWSTTNYSGSLVELSLCNIKEELCAVIASNRPARGSYSWTIPSREVFSMNTGTAYKILAKIPSVAIDYSDNLFSIFGDGTEPYCKLPRWNCTDWSVCQNGSQIRVCADINKCEPNKTETRACSLNPLSCVASRECIDAYESCYYSCVSGTCQRMDAFVTVRPYPDCSSIIKIIN